jgi:hypothetical protein
MSKPWEIELTKDQLGKFRRILRDLKDIRYGGMSNICPFDSFNCNRSRPTCGSFIKGLKKITHIRRCPCFSFRTASLIWRIEALLEYNKRLHSIHK